MVELQQRTITVLVSVLQTLKLSRILCARCHLPRHPTHARGHEHGAKRGDRATTATHNATHECFVGWRHRK
jgi:hypothetical protein